MAKKDELTVKQKAFADEYLLDFNASRAYKKIYKQDNDKTCEVSASKLLSNTKVRKQVLDRLPSEIKTADIITKALNRKTPDNISWKDIHRFVNTALKLKGYLGDKPQTDIKIGLVVNND